MREKKLDEALAKTKEAQAASGEKAALRYFFIDVLLFQIFSRAGHGRRNPDAGHASQSQYASAEQQRSWLKNIPFTTSSRRLTPRLWMLPIKPSSTARTTATPCV